jgi:hypothetical protein
MELVPVAAPTLVAVLPFIPTVTFAFMVAMVAPA